MDAELIFVYNADSGVGNAIMDTLHKTLSPKTYSCHLCEITHGPIGMKKEWREFIEKLPLKVRFLHRDEWLELHNRKDNLPAVFLIENGSIEEFIRTHELGELSLNNFMGLISMRVKTLIK